MTADERRLAVEQVEARFLRGLDKDEDEALALLVERSRLTLYGSLAITAAALTAASAMDQALNLWLLGAGILLQQAGAVAGWNGLQYAEVLRHNRVVRKLLENQAGLHARFGGEDPLFPSVSDDALTEARADERKAGAKIRSRETLAVWFISFGFALLLGAFLQALEVPRPIPQVPEAGSPSGHRH